MHKLSTAFLGLVGGGCAGCAAPQGVATNRVELDFSHPGAPASRLLWGETSLNET